MLEAEHKEQPVDIDQLEVAVDSDTADTQQSVKATPKSSNTGRGKGMTLSVSNSDFNFQGRHK